MTEKERMVPMVVRIPAALHDELRDRAKAEDRSMAQVLRRALRLYLELPVDAR